LLNSVRAKAQGLVGLQPRRIIHWESRKREKFEEA
jgi:hypothetical protein